MSYLFAAYTIIWTLLFVFLLFLWQRQSKLQSRIETLARFKKNN